MKLKSICKVLFITTLLNISLFSNENNSKIEIINDELYAYGNFYFIKGIVINTGNKALKNVTIKYYIWKKRMGKNGHGSIIRDTGGLVISTIKYLPSNIPIDFTTKLNENAPIMTKSSGLLPDTLNAKITFDN